MHPAERQRSRVGVEAARAGQGSVERARSCRGRHSTASPEPPACTISLVICRIELRGAPNMDDRRRAWTLSVLSSVVAAATGVMINIATGPGNSLTAWIVTVLLAVIAGAIAAVLQIKNPVSDPQSSGPSRIGVTNYYVEQEDRAQISITHPTASGMSIGLVFAIATVVIVALVSGFLVSDYTNSVNRDTVSTAEASPTSTSASPPASVGDPRTADPCALTNTVALARFGATRSVTGYGNFNRCGVEVQADETVVGVKVALEETGDEVPGPVEQVGQLGIVREPAKDEECDRYVLLPDGYQVAITAILRKGVAADLCAMAEVATDSAVAVLRRGEIPRRSVPFDATSLAGVDACSLLDGDALAAVPGIDAAEPDPGFASWECQWGSSTEPLSVQLIFDRRRPLSGDDGRLVRIAGHEGAVEPEGYGDETCVAKVVHQPSSDAYANPKVELMLVVVRGPQPPEQLCAPATALAEAAAAELPAQ